MPLLTEYTSFADAQTHCSKERLWELFDGSRDSINIAHECIDRHPRDRVAVRIALAAGGSESITFGELSDWAGRYANYLRAQGIGPGERVALMVEPSLPFYVALYGAMKAGCVAVPLFTLFGPDGLRLRVGDCQPKLLLLAPEKADLAADAGCNVAIADDDFMAMLENHETAFETTTTGRDMAMFQYTSGTTRELPDAVKHRHQSVVTVMLAALYGTGQRPGDRFMCPSSTAWGHGLWHGTLAPHAMGITTASYAGKFDPDRLMAALEEFDITNLSAAATHYRMMKNAGTAGRYNFNLEKVSFTGEPMDTDTAEWARETFGQYPGSFYGTTEVGVLLGSYPGADDLPPMLGSLGMPMPGQEVAILNPQGEHCAPDEVGEIMVMRPDGWFPTKDRGHVDGDGYFYHGGRADDVIISAGYTMSAMEIEDTLLKHADVLEAAAIGAPDEVRGLVVKAFIVTDRPGDDGFIKELQTFVQDNLSRHEYPRIVEFTNELPKTPAGKVNRKTLRDREAAARGE
ncbi:MAG: AMP-binding protein [Rhodospirillaceae bacterium]|nr:AMP-binding protein [Rhodospirillaceae bacterium]MBT5192218.1 AMP-binding protein [Rhodospirillaceae bacterium]MBT5896294.1 AMP-binding protein [Rhodospirillaceae bacterium]MBT6428007.1 AMP-binding protein [Rhodospirillaceae bacterium]MBT7755989.1 AMP-binding protein [Rhodospirillaceae bacterium]